MAVRWRIALGLIVSLALGACVPDQAQNPDGRPTVATPPPAASPPAAAPVGAPAAAASMPTSAPPIPTVPIRFTRFVPNIPIGTRVGTYRSEWSCARGGDAIVWGDGSGTGLQSPDYEARFVDVLTRAGYRIASDRNQLFDAQAEQQAARYLVGAQLMEVKTSLCAAKSVWDGRPLGIYGDSTITVEWQVYSVGERRVVYTKRTSGSARSTEGTADGTVRLTRAAFGAAAAGLAADRDFRNLVALRDGGSPTAGPLGDDPLELPRYAMLREGINTRLVELRSGAVTILTGASTGSGFFVSDDGLILTNRHVVGEAMTVNVRLLGGVELTGRVLRRHTARDVALVKVDLGRTRVLPLRLEPVRLGEEVYALGSPLTPELAGSVTRGIVSAVRAQGPASPGMEVIQSDVAIYGGSSGGPLLDASGNVVGIAVSGMTGRSGQGTALNFFIPIEDALRYLNIRLGQPRELRF